MSGSGPLPELSGGIAPVWSRFNSGAGGSGKGFAPSAGGSAAGAFPAPPDNILFSSLLFYFSLFS